MPPKPNPDLLLAQTLAAPFTPRGQGSPLSLRRLPDGGMVVIAGDGRKLWFSPAEVETARDRLEEQAKKEGQLPASKTPVKLAAAIQPPSRAHEGAPLRAAISPDLKVKHDHPNHP